MRSFSEKSDLAVWYQNLDLVESLTSTQQRIDLYRHPLLGGILVIDGEIQHVEHWQALYHEPLVHLPASFIKEIRDVLILGGGSLYAAAEALKYSSVRRCTLVDYDPRVIDLMSRHYHHATRVLDDGRFDYINCDAIEYLQMTDKSFDLIINDCFDSLLVSKAIGLPALDLMTRRLTSVGVCSDLIYRHIFEKEHLSGTRRALAKMAQYGISLLSVPDYPGVLHVLTFWGANICQNMRSPRNDIQKLWCKGMDRPDLQFFDPNFLSFHLYLPPYLRREWADLADEGATKA